MSWAGDVEIVDDAHGVVIRRVIVGPLDTKCWILPGTHSAKALVIDTPVWPLELDHLQREDHFDAGTATEQLLACGCSVALPTGTAP